MSKLTFITDVEGNWNYVNNLLKVSKCVYLDKKTKRLRLADNSMLVYGGDAGDKGTHTLRMYTKLVQLKKEFPDRVILIAGNRDINKMRFISELEDEKEMDLNHMAKEILYGPMWVPQDKRLTLLDFLHAQSTLEQNEKGLGSESTPKDLKSVNTKINRLKWMLDHTMGSQGDFDRRRQELAEMTETSSDSISDGQVLQSYLDSVYPDGVIHQYLSLAQLAFICKESLFVHGGIINGQDKEKSSFSVLSSLPGGKETFSSVHEWAAGLNNWYRSQFRDWVKNPFWSKDHETRGGNHLMAYALPDRQPISVVTAKHLDASRMPVQLPHSLAKKLADNGIKRLIVGHTPHGDRPTVISQTDDTAFEHVIMADTSYSDQNAKDNRGTAASEIVVADSASPGGTIVKLYGVRKDNSTFSETLK